MVDLLVLDEPAVPVELAVPLLFRALLPIMEVKVETVIILMSLLVLVAVAVLLAPIEMVMVVRMQIIQVMVDVVVRTA